RPRAPVVRPVGLGAGPVLPPGAGRRRVPPWLLSAGCRGCRARPAARPAALRPSLPAPRSRPSAFAPAR
ncbi:hypothetical protein C3R44_21250, partial [Mycobacterium tuberculosis]